VRILLDTHLLLWWLADSPALPKLARIYIADPENTIFISAVCLWEIWLKQSIGKLHLEAGFADAVAAGSFEALPLTGEHAQEVAHLPWHHRDPFDRMLVAQARVSGLIFLTADEILGAYGETVRVVR
jgi:PIN domain nuclease of toxin-antitoxin system